ncbi:MAG: ABC transporter substrate-binding protein [Chloroflexia bacterium]|nr:ABC transporter substrate-binding protein [Chloroflexia bacterium]
MMRWLLLVILLAFGLSACGGNGAGGIAPTPTNPEPVRLRVGLDWTPNTNHTGLYVARDRGFYREQGLEVEILQAQEGGTVEQLVATGRLDLGISYQEAVTEARVVGLPIVSVAAIIQSNTSGFASRAARGITTPADFAGHRYGAWGSPVEQAVIAGLMECVGADASQVQFVDIGSSDFFVATERDAIDFAWIFAGWTGVEAAQRGIDLNIVMIRDLNCIPDYYTPVLITSEELIATQPDLLRRFMAATSAGYQYAIEEPDAAAALLLEAVPELDAEIVTQSQAYLANEYQGNAPRWGEQRVEVWRDYAQWMVERDLLSSMIDPEQAFTNAFLP